jgi:hypothetical protein
MNGAVTGVPSGLLSTPGPLLGATPSGDIKTKLIEESNFVLVTSGLLYRFFSMIFMIYVKCNKISISLT